jgi:hypothetical protein
MAFMKELAEFTHFWEGTMKRFREVSDQEMANLIVQNKELSNEVGWGRVLTKGLRINGESVWIPSSS